MSLGFNGQNFQVPSRTLNRVATVELNPTIGTGQNYALNQSLHYCQLINNYKNTS